MYSKEMMKDRSQLKVLASCTLISLILVSGCSNSSTESTKPSTVTTQQAKQLIRTLFYERQQAWNSGTQAGLDFDSAHNYPGAFDSAASAECAKKGQLVENKYFNSTSVDLNTFSIDENWQGPKLKYQDYLFSGKKPRGQTFIVTGSTSSSDINHPLSESISTDFHVTVLEGKPYFFFGKCLS